MTDKLTQAYLDKMAAQSKELTAKVEVLKARLAKEGANFQIEYNTQISEWHHMEEAFGKQLQAASLFTAENFETAKGEVQNAWEGLIKYVGDHFDKAQDAVLAQTESLTTAKKSE